MDTFTWTCSPGTRRFPWSVYVKEDDSQPGACCGLQEFPKIAAQYPVLSPFVFSLRVGMKQQIICLIHKITFLRHSRPVLGALCLRFALTGGLCEGLLRLF